MFGLTEEEAAELDSEDEYFYGFTNDDNHLSCNEVNISDSEESDDEEGETSGILSDSDLQESVISFVSDTPQGKRSSIPRSDIGVISSESDPLYIKIDEKLSEGCSCSISCLSQFETNEVFRFHLMLCEMQKCEKDMLLLGKLQVISKAQDDTHHARQTTAGKRKRVTCEYAFDRRPVCRDGFLFLHNLGSKQLKNLQHHLKLNGPVPREHGLLGHVPATTYPFDIVSDAAQFIKNFAEINGIPQPAARSGRAKNPPVYLPASLNYKIVHLKYVEACQLKDSHTNFLAYKTFVNVWKKCLPDIIFMTPRTDVCVYCEKFRVQLKTAVHEEEKVKVTSEFSAHLEEAQKERDNYLTSMKKAESTLIEHKEGPLSYAHYTFDFAQCVHIPHHARQVGPLYFKTPRKIQIFGICCDSNKKQHNYLIDENCSIGTNGTKTHGPNSVVSMLDHYFDTHGLNETTCHLHCDNCVGQNKNNCVAGYLAWRTITGKNQEITLSFMRVGHTRCLVDGHFGLIKKIYRQCDTDTLDQMVEVVQRSSTNNLTQLCTWEWRDWDYFFKKLFKRIPYITKCQHFRFAATKPGQVFVRSSCTSEEKVISIFKKKVTVAAIKRKGLPEVIPQAGLTADRKKYLYVEIRPFVTPEYQDITCPPP